MYDEPYMPDGPVGSMPDAGYDPTSDPRHLPRIDLSERLAFFDAEQMDLQTEIGIIGEVVALFERPGYAHIAAELERHAASCDRVMRLTTDVGTWKYMRGQLSMIQWFQGLADDYRKMLDTAHAKMREVDEQIEQIQGAE